MVWAPPLFGACPGFAVIVGALIKFRKSAIERDVVEGESEIVESRAEASDAVE